MNAAKYNILRTHHIMILMMMMVFLFSCTPQKLFRSSNDGIANDSDLVILMQKKEYIIMPDDKISLSIWDNDELSIGSVYGIYNSNEVYGKWILVDKLGDASFPKVGKVKLQGLTIHEANMAVVELYKKLIVNPVVVVRVLNREVTVLGEIKSSGVYTFEKEYNSLTSIVGKAGGFDYFADASKIKIIRGRDENKKEYVIDLTQLNSIQQDNIYLQAGDIVYVPPVKKKAYQKESPSIVPVISLISSLAIVASLIFK